MKNKSIIFRWPFGQLPFDFILVCFFLLGNSSLLLSQQANPHKTKNDAVVMDTSATVLPSFFDDGNVNSFDDFQFVFGNGIVATQDQDAADKFAQLIGVGFGKRTMNKVGSYYPRPKSKDATFIAAMDDGYIGYNGKINRSEKDYNQDPTGNVWLTLEEFGKYPPNLGGGYKLVLK
jgi:hypothetical protein